MSTVIKDPITGALLEVTNGRQLKVKQANPVDVDGSEHFTDVGSVRMQSEIDAGTVTGAPLLKALEVSSDYRLRVGVDHSVINELFPGTVLNTALWTTPTTTMTATVAGGFVNLNTGLSLASGAVARLSSYRSFPCYKSYTTYYESQLQFTETPINGNVCEWGSGIATGVATPTDGCFFRLNSAGEFRAVVNNNGLELQSASLNFASLIGVNTSRLFLIYVISNKALFWIDNILVAEVDMAIAQGSITSSMQLPVLFRNYNSTAVSTAQVMKISFVNVTMADQNTSKLWNSILCGAGGHSSQGQTGQTMGSTALYSNNLAAGAGVAMTNTTAALGSGLGGQFSALPTLAVGTDGIVSNFQVPLGSSLIPAKTLYITRITLNAAVTTTLAGGNVLYAYSLAYGHTNVSLATTETATSKASRRIPIGLHNFAAAAPAGTIAGIIDLDLNSPIVVQPGEFVQLVAKNLGAVTTAGVITFLVSFGGYWE
jgi:hypothetical protein